MCTVGWQRRVGNKQHHAAPFLKPTQPDPMNHRKALLQLQGCVQSLNASSSVDAEWGGRVACAVGPAKHLWDMVVRGAVCTSPVCERDTHCTRQLAEAPVFVPVAPPQQWMRALRRCALRPDACSELVQRCMLLLGVVPASVATTPYSATKRAHAIEAVIWSVFSKRNVFTTDTRANPAQPQPHARARLCRLRALECTIQRLLQFCESERTPRCAERMVWGMARMATRAGTEFTQAVLLDSLLDAVFGMLVHQRMVLWGGGAQWPRRSDWQPLHTAHAHVRGAWAEWLTRATL